MRSAQVRALVGAALALTAGPAFAQPAGTIDVADSGDTAWLLTAATLVLLLAIPGLTMFYGGLVRTKNVLAVFVQCSAIVAAASLMWVICGYTMAFGEVTSGWLGGGNALLLRDLGNVRDGLAVPESAFALFQMTAAAFAPALMVGAWVDRARFGWVIGFAALWSLVVYAPVAHWVWGGGWLASRLGTLDFAGGIVIHTAAGVSALVAALLVGKRQGFPERQMSFHSPALRMAGAALMWVGWFGLSGGWALAANDDTASAIINTHLAAAAAALAWLAIEKWRVGKPSGVGFATGAVAGLVTVSPAAGFIDPAAAILCGVIAAGVCHTAIQLVKQKLQIDDSLDVFALHGVGGMTGALLLAVFLHPFLGGTGYAPDMTMARQLGAQAAGVGVVTLWSSVASAILAVAVSFILPMRVKEEEEREGLDISSHGERAWELE